MKKTHIKVDVPAGYTGKVAATIGPFPELMQLFRLEVSAPKLKRDNGDLAVVRVLDHKDRQPVDAMIDRPHDRLFVWEPFEPYRLYAGHTLRVLIDSSAASEFTITHTLA